MDHLIQSRPEAQRVRAGGSVINVDGKGVPAVSWTDGYGTDVPQTWIETFKRFSYRNCRRPLAVISDSVRVMSELRFAASDKLILFNCCNQPLHRDRLSEEGFFYQEVIDLFILARSSRIVSGVGGFFLLGKYWLGIDGPKITRATNKKEIDAAMAELLAEASCDIKDDG